jgi:hypothetical protein
MMIGIVGLTISCMKCQETYRRFKVKYNREETLRSITLLGEATSILEVDLEEEDEEEEWVEAEDRSSVITAHTKTPCKGFPEPLYHLQLLLLV